MKVHLAIAVKDLESSVEEYKSILGAEPDLVIPGQYALWRTSILNLSIRYTAGSDAGVVRHVGFERDDASKLEEHRDINGIVWETFNKHQQAAEIRNAWKDVDYEPK